MQTDTVVGIVGAVVLVGVMVGVFAYEYNVSDDVGDDNGPAASMAAFNETYPGLSATGDLDGDGIANHADPDMDGDGTANADDATNAYEADLSGTVAMSTASTQSDTKPFHVDGGATNIRIVITFDRPLPLPGVATQQPSLDFNLIDPAGQSYTGTETPGALGSASVTVTYDLSSAPFLAGEWTLTASSNSLTAPEIDYAASLRVGYDSQA